MNRCRGHVVTAPVVDAVPGSLRVQGCGGQHAAAALGAAEGAGKSAQLGGVGAAPAHAVEELAVLYVLAALQGALKWNETKQYKARYSPKRRRRERSLCFNI